MPPPPGTTTTATASPVKSSLWLEERPPRPPTWDAADNRLSMTKGGAEGTSTATYAHNALNQMTGWENGAVTVDYAYDANGNRTHKTETKEGVSSSTTYTYDEDNRLIATALNGTEITHTFAYDYRSRRYYRSTPTTPHMYSVFDGGLSIQEYETISANSDLSTHMPTTEFIRSEGMGGGVGGMVYSIKDDGNGGDSIISSHANHRGDVIARSNESRSLTSFALYEAYGTRPYEWSAPGTEGDPDRQKANTKEEESDLGLLNEGRRYRDLETGTFLTRDPIGYGDGPNMYCYVHCNPITKFDAWGLSETATDEDVEEAKAKADEAREEMLAEEAQLEVDQQAEKDALRDAVKTGAKSFNDRDNKEKEDAAGKASEKYKKAADTLSQSASRTKAAQDNYKSKYSDYWGKDQGNKAEKNYQEKMGNMDMTAITISGSAIPFGGPTGGVGMAVNDDGSIQFFIVAGGGSGNDVSVDISLTRGDNAMLEGSSYTASGSAAFVSFSKSTDFNGHSSKSIGLTFGSDSVLGGSVKYTEGFATDPLFQR